MQRREDSLISSAYRMYFDVVFAFERPIKILKKEIISLSLINFLKIKPYEQTHFQKVIVNIRKINTQ